jgi:hypothetical protein
MALIPGEDESWHLQDARTDLREATATQLHIDSVATLRGYLRASLELLVAVDDEGALTALDTAATGALGTKWRSRVDGYSKARIAQIRRAKADRLAGLIERQRSNRAVMIVEMVALRHNLTPETVRASRSRMRHIIHARQEAAWIVRTKLEWSYPSIAAFFGWSDHTSAMHAVAAHARRMGARG